MKGILFRSEMVKAIREGRKTQTRRLMKPPTVEYGDELYVKPRYQIGEIVYVKESWAAMAIFDDRLPHKLDVGTPIWYADTPGDDPTNCSWDKGKQRSPLFMPARAARIFLQIEDVRVQRLQEITEEDAIKEGCSKELIPGIELPSAKRRYSYLWDSINKKPGTRWEDDPWLFAYTFKACHGQRH